MQAGAGDHASGPALPRVVPAVPPPVPRFRYGEYVPPRPASGHRTLAVVAGGLAVLVLLVMGTVALVSPW